MKILLFVVSLGFCGFFGYWLRGLNRSPVYDSGLIDIPSHPMNYPLRSFETINREMPDILARSCGEDARHEQLVFVIPYPLGGYQISVPGHPDGYSLTPPQRERLIDLIRRRMRELTFSPPQD